jgi:hypothetical protein
MDYKGALIKSGSSGQTLVAHTCNLSYSGGKDQERIKVWSKPGQIVRKILSWKYPTLKKGWWSGVAQAAECLCSKLKILSSNPSTPPQKTPKLKQSFRVCTIMSVLRLGEEASAQDRVWRRSVQKVAYCFPLCTWQGWFFIPRHKFQRTHLPVWLMSLLYKSNKDKCLLGARQREMKKQDG